MNNYRRKYSIFYEDNGGYRSTDNLNLPLEEVYYIGIIDIFTRYSLKKRLETFFKSIVSDRTKISAMVPKDYALRFIKFITDSLEGFEADRFESRIEAINALLNTPGWIMRGPSKSPPIKISAHRTNSHR